MKKFFKDVVEVVLTVSVMLGLLGILATPVIGFVAGFAGHDYTSNGSCIHGYEKRALRAKLTKGIYEYPCRFGNWLADHSTYRD